VSGPLDKYNRKRRFDRTPEPAGKVGESTETLSFVVQMHAATRLHYDFRLEHGGVLWSWAVPQGPSYDPDTKRLAVRTEDHPLSYGGFEGVIPKGEYGGGAVVVWDRGTWTPREDPERGLAKGHLSFDLHGERLHGHWHLVEIKGREEEGDNWLLFKAKDGLASQEVDVTAMFQDSVLSGRTLDEVAAEPHRVWRSGKGVVGPVDPAGVAGATRSALPRNVEPQLAKAADGAPTGDGWLHEIKHDGYRVQIRMDGDEVRLYTRGGHDWTAKFGRLAEAAAVLPANSALIDGEVVVLRDDGASDFGLLQQALSDGNQAAMWYYAFDLLHAEGWDLRDVALWRRKELLKCLLDHAPSQSRAIRYTDHVEGNGALFFEQVAALGLEGMVSKRRDARYRSGRSDAWRKLKCLHRQEFVVVGYTDIEAGTGVGALVLGAWEEGVLRPAGRVGSGFSDAQRDRLREALATTETPAPPLRYSEDDPDDLRGVHWVEPRLVVEVSFTGWTQVDRLRHPTFVGFREDADPATVSRRPEAATSAVQVADPSPGARAALGRIKITHPERVLWPGAGVTKAELLAYYAAIAEHVLPELANRPLSLVRCPKGSVGDCFFQKHAETKGVPEWVRRVEVPTEGEAPFLYVDSLEGLLSLAQMNTLEYHPWGATVDDPERPDRMIFDLDPAEGTPWPRVAEAAFWIREALEALGLSAFPRSTGGKGLHVVVPVRPEHEWSVVRDLSRAIAESVVKRHRDRLTLAHNIEARRGRLYIDVLRNARGATAVGTWSTRARPGAPIAVPLRWDEVVALGGGNRFNVRNIFGRLAALSEPAWTGFAEAAAPIDQALLTFP
jgi:bifunctional non-homologous end joining protein LigD